MRKKVFRVTLALLLLVAAICAWLLLGSATGFADDKRYLYIASKAATKEAVMDSIEHNDLLSSKASFRLVAGRMGYWENIRPGRYEIKRGASLLDIVRMLRNGRQAPVDIVIKKFRTKEDFAKAAGARFEFGESGLLAFLNNPDSMRRFNTDTAAVFVNVLPNTYRYYWTTTPAAFYQKLYDETQAFWTPERRRKAKEIGLELKDVYTLASIIEEETTNHKEKDTIASVYLNRLRVGMPLQADPTLKFAVRDFALKRIAGPITKVESTYNTYQNRGLPPGPICTPSTITLDAVLNPASTPFFYFVANSRLSGHLFSQDFDEHVQKANAYRQQDKLRRQKDSAKKKEI